MADTFEDLGIARDLAAGAERLGWEAPTGLQRDAIPVIRRGHNLVLHASAGSGVVGAFGLGVLDRLLEDGGGLRTLVLVPDAGAASDTADSLARLAAGTGLAIRADAVGWTGGDADLLVVSAATAAAAVRSSALKLGEIRTLVIDGADQLTDTGQGPDLETLVEAIPGSAQRVLVTGRLDPDMDDFVERHVRRAMTVPPQPADGEKRDAPEGPSVRYTVIADRRKTAAAVQLLTSMSAAELAVVCRTRARAEQVASGLADRGIPVIGHSDSPDDRRVLVLPRLEADRRTTRALVLSFDVPFDADELQALHGNGGTVIVTPRERAHLTRTAHRSGIVLDPVTLPEPTVLAATEALRDRLKSTLVDEDLAVELALLEPLLADHPAAEVAASAPRGPDMGAPVHDRGEPRRAGTG
jgi:ATP-dependent RNA helicase DeaD